MKRPIALPIVVFASVALIRIVCAGSEPLSGKEMKQVAPAPLPECNWTGFYFGALAGYSRGDLVCKDVYFGDNETLIDRDQSGALYGGELGFNYQWNWLVLRIEGTFAYSDVQAHSAKDLGDEPNIYDTRSNWQGTVGGGVEYMINCHWSAKLEYNHSFLGTDNIKGTRIDDGFPEEESYQVKLNQDTVWVGINYKFWGFR